MKLNPAKQRIVDYVIKTTEASSLASVHISKLIKALDINRNTFYYHFDSKHDVAMYVFRTDLANQLRLRVDHDHLLEAPVSRKPRSGNLPFYMHYEIGARLLDHSDFYKALVECVMSRPDFYRKIFSPNEPEIKAAIFDLYRNAIGNDILFTLGERYMPQETFDFLLFMQLNTVYEVPLYHLSNPKASQSLLDDELNPFWNYPHEMLTFELQDHPIRRPRRY